VSRGTYAVFTQVSLDLALLFEQLVGPQHLEGGA
jgi:hypothetical protein